MIAFDPGLKVAAARHAAVVRAEAVEAGDWVSTAPTTMRSEVVFRRVEHVTVTHGQQVELRLALSDLDSVITVSMTAGREVLVLPAATEDGDAS